MLPAGSFCIHPSHIVLKMFEAVHPENYPGELAHLHMAQDLKKQIMDFVNVQDV